MPDLPARLTPEQTFALADGSYGACRLVHDFLGETVRPIIDRVDPRTEEERTFLGVLLRAHAWLRSLAKLNHPGDFQAVAAGARALFECAIDASVLLHKPNAESWERMKAWEESSKLKAAEGLVKFYRDRGAPVPDHHYFMEHFVQSDSARVAGLRATHFGGKHPARWTGRDLRAEAVAVDSSEPLGLTEFYDVRYRQLCWDTHASAFTAIRSLSSDDFPGLTARAFQDAAVMAVITARQVLRLFGQFDDVTRARFEQLDKARQEEIARAVLPTLKR